MAYCVNFLHSRDGMDFLVGTRLGSGILDIFVA